MEFVVGRCGVQTVCDKGWIMQYEGSGFLTNFSAFFLTLTLAYAFVD